MKVKLEYIWLDGNEPTQKLRSKTKIWDYDPMDSPKMQAKRTMAYNGRVIPCPEELPNWSFDGSSTNQAIGNKSDCILKPVHVIMDPQRLDGYLVMCEVLNPDGTPHTTNKRYDLVDDDQYWFGFEQEYILSKKNGPIGFPTDGFPKPQGDYYCGLGAGNVIGRDIVEEHLQVCLEANLNITGTNAEVMIGQWEYQLFAEGAKKASDELWLSRFLLIRLTEKYDLMVDFKPKPVEGDCVMLMCVNPLETAKRSVIRTVCATSVSLSPKDRGTGDENTGAQATETMERTTSKQAYHLRSIPMLVGTGRSL